MIVKIYPYKSFLLAFSFGTIFVKVCGIFIQVSAVEAVEKSLSAVLNRTMKSSLLLIVHRIRNIMFPKLLKKVSHNFSVFYKQTRN